MRAAVGLRRAAHAEAGAVRRQHARCRGDRGRQGRGAAAVRRVGEHVRGQRSGRGGRRGRRRGRGRAGRGVRGRRTAWRRSSPRRATGTSRCATAPRIEVGLRGVPRRRAGSARSPRTSRTWAVCGSCPGLAVQRLMADGLRLRWRGRLEDGVLLRGVEGDGRGLPGGTSFMEDYTYDLVPGQRADPRRAHAGGVPDDRCAASRRARSTRWASAGGRIRSGWCSTPPRVRRWSSAWPTWGTVSGWWPTRSRWSRRPSRCRGCRWRGRCGGRRRICGRRRRRG